MNKYEHEIRGLTVTRHGGGWIVAHAGSGLHATGTLRQRRFAEQARDELLATGVDFTQDSRTVSAAREQWSGVYYRWQQRTRQRKFDEATGEYYSASVGMNFIPSAAWAQAYRNASAAHDGEEIMRLVRHRNRAVRELSER